MNSGCIHWHKDCSQVSITSKSTTLSIQKDLQLSKHFNALAVKLEDEVDRMVQLGAIKKIDKPTDWVSSLVAVEKPKARSLRIYLDQGDLHKAIKCEHYLLPTLDDITAKLARAKYLTRFTPGHSETTTPHRKRYSREQMSLCGKSQQEAAFKKMKDVITQELGPVLAYFDPKKEVVLQVDASKSRDWVQHRCKTTDE